MPARATETRRRRARSRRQGLLAPYLTLIYVTLKGAKINLVSNSRQRFPQCCSHLKVIGLREKARPVERGRRGSALATRRLRRRPRPLSPEPGAARVLKLAKNDTLPCGPACSLPQPCSQNILDTDKSIPYADKSCKDKGTARGVSGAAQAPETLPRSTLLICVPISATESERSIV